MRVLVATDGSGCADVAVNLVAAIAWPPGSTIHVVEAVASGLAVFGGPWPPLPAVDTTEFDEDIRRQANSDLVTARVRLTAPDRTLETSIATGRAADVIISLAEQTSADVIVVGSRGHGTLESMLLGSVSAEVVDRSRVPVLVARGSAITRVVFGWDGSAGAERAARFLMGSNLFHEAEVQVISVADSMPPRTADIGFVGEGLSSVSYEMAAEPSREQHLQLAQEMAQQLQKAGLKPVPQRREGDPAEQLVRVADSWPADLVVVGTHGRTGLTRLLMGSVARNVLHHAPCSVLIVREPSTDEDTV